MKSRVLPYVARLVCSRGAVRVKLLQRKEVLMRAVDFSHSSGVLHGALGGSDAFQDWVSERCEWRCWEWGQHGGEVAGGRSGVRCKGCCQRRSLWVGD